MANTPGMIRIWLTGLSTNGTNFAFWPQDYVKAGGKHEKGSVSMRDRGRLRVYGSEKLEDHDSRMANGVRSY